jgi:uncharacterized protein (TIRG00374 family)
VLPAERYRARILALIRRAARSFWVRLVVSAGLLALVATHIDLAGARARLASGSWGLFAAAAAVLFASFLLGAVRWHIYLSAVGIDVPLLGAVRAYLIGTFGTNFLPSQFGGDVARAWIASGQGTRLRSAATVLVDRATALLCLLVIGWLAVASNPGPVPSQLLIALATASTAYAVAAFTVIVVSRSGRLRRLLPVRLRSQAGEMLRSLRACFRPAVLARTLLVGLAFQGLVVLAAWLVARSISLHAPFSVVAASLAPVLILTAVPLSIGGLGVREGGFVVLLGYAGVGTTGATVFSLLSAVAFAIASLSGGLALARPAARSVASAQAHDREQKRHEEDLQAHDHERRSEHDQTLL